MGCRKFTCMISTSSAGSETRGATNILPANPVFKNSMPAFTAIMAIPMGTIISGSSVL